MPSSLSLSSSGQSCSHSEWSSKSDCHTDEAGLAASRRAVMAPAATVHRVVEARRETG